MRSFWLVAKHEYRGTVVRRGFLIMIIAIPLGMAALIALAILVESMGADSRPVGYVDYSGTLDAGLLASMPSGNGHTEIRSFADEDLGRAALEAEEIQALFVLPAEYPRTLNSDLYYLEDPPGGDAWRDFDDFVRVNLLSAMPEEMQELLREGPEITVYDLASNREFSEASIINVILPFVATFFFVFSTMSGAGYMLSVVAGEKETGRMISRVSFFPCRWAFQRSLATRIPRTLSMFSSMNGIRRCPSSSIRAMASSTEAVA